MHRQRGDTQKPILVGEAGITIQDYRDGDRLTRERTEDPKLIFDRLVESFDMACQFSHHTHDEGPDGTWGVQNWDETPPENLTNRSLTGRLIRTSNASVPQLSQFWQHLKGRFVRMTDD
jgi:hypothetical protein